MHDRDDLDTFSPFTKDNEEGKPTKETSPCAEQVGRPAAWSLLDSLDGLIELRHEGLGQLSVAGVVPVSCGARFLDRLRMKPNPLVGHYSPRMMRRALGHGIGATAPESSSWIRFAISAAQAASASSSTPSSKLSRSEAASAARASGESLSASFRSFAGSGLMS